MTATTPPTAGNGDTRDDMIKYTQVLLLHDEEELHLIRNYDPHKDDSVQTLCGLIVQNTGQMIPIREVTDSEIYKLPIKRNSPFEEVMKPLGQPPCDRCMLKAINFHRTKGSDNDS